MKTKGEEKFIGVGKKVEQRTEPQKGATPVKQHQGLKAQNKI